MSKSTRIMADSFILESGKVKQKCIGRARIGVVRGLGLEFKAKFNFLTEVLFHERETFK